MEIKEVPGVRRRVSGERRKEVSVGTSAAWIWLNGWNKLSAFSYYNNNIIISFFGWVWVIPLLSWCVVNRLIQLLSRLHPKFPKPLTSWPSSPVSHPTSTVSRSHRWLCWRSWEWRQGILRSCNLRIRIAAEKCRGFYRIRSCSPKGKYLFWN